MLAVFAEVYTPLAACFPIPEPPMPFTRIAIPAGTSSAHKAAIARGVHAAMVAAIGIPEDDFFQLLSEYQPGDFLFYRGFLGVQRSARPVIVQLTLRHGPRHPTTRHPYDRLAPP